MKKLILSLFVCVLSVFCSLDAQIYQPSIYDRSERKTTIGYTTNYSNGKFNSSVYDGFNPGNNRSSHIRRIKGYTADGDSIDTGHNRRGNPDDMWNNNYNYYWDGSNWWRKDKNGNYYLWTNLFGWRWYDPWGILYDTEPPEGTPQYYQNPMPISSIYPFLLYVLYM